MTVASPPNVHVTRLVSKGQQSRSCHHEAGRAICSWGGLDDVSSYCPGNDRVSCQPGTAKPDGPEYPRRVWLRDPDSLQMWFGIDRTNSCHNVLGPLCSRAMHYEVQEDVWDSLAPHSLPQCSPVDRIEGCFDVKVCYMQQAVKFSMKLRQQTQSKDGINCGPASSEARLMWSASSV